MVKELSSEVQQKIWEAILARDSQWDGCVYYGVKTTGIYCRPSCPSKRPKREYVEYFRSAIDAERKGYRACKRCQPDVIAEEEAEFHRLMKILEDTTIEINSVHMWASQAGLPVRKLRKVIQQKSGISPRDLILRKKVILFKRNIQAGELVITSQFAAGFGSSSRLYEKAANTLGMTPGQYKNGGMGMKIVYELLDTPLGKMIMAGTERGVCSVKFGEDSDSLVKDLGAEFPRAFIEKHNGELDGWVEQMRNYFTGEVCRFAIPLEIQATAFQMKVWEELRKIPFGETRSYSQLAESVGKPSAARAVATACAANPVAIVNPCHRIIHSNGTLSGYRWGVERKKALLEMEKKFQSPD